MTHTATRRLSCAVPTLAVAVALAACAATPSPAATENAAEPPGRVERLAPSSMAYAQDRLQASADRLDPADGYPRSTGANGRWTTREVSDWTTGYFAGTLWTLYERNREPAWRARAERWTAGIASEKSRTDTHDLGLMFSDSFGKQARLTDDPAARDIAVAAARSLATRFDDAVGAIKSWDTAGFGEPELESWRFPVIIDSMMNLELLYWAGGQPGGDPIWRDMATRHALTTLGTLMRPDGSTAHVGLFDPTTGTFLRQETWQGLAPESTWSRGQAWAIYGFTDAHRESGRPELLEGAQRAADRYLERLPADRVPYWDFDAPDIPATERDASAAAIAASGLYELARITGGPRGEGYRRAADETLASLCSGYLTEGTGSDAVLAHSVGFLPKGREVDVGMVYADHYFVEALMRSGHLP